MANINKIRLSGTTYSIQDENATKTVELTQAEYDALSPKDPNTFYIITDATAGDLSNYYTKTETDGLLDTKLDVTAFTPTDLSNYYTKSETSGATEISTALASKADTATTYTKTETDNAITAAASTKQDTLVSGTNIKTINGETLLGEGNITIQGGSGGGKAVSGGTNIIITTGETADTINCKLPYYIDSGACWTIFGDSRYGSNKSTNASSSAYIGFNNEIKNTSTSYNTYDNIIIGWGNKLDSYYDSFGVGYNVIIGENNTLSGSKNFRQSYVIGRYNKGYASDEFICGWSNESRNHYETSFGQYNNSVSASTTFGDSGNTLFSVGNGTDDNARHNAFEIRQNGDIYITKDGQDVKLQDQLVGGGSSYTAGDGIDINNDVISVTGKVDTSTYNTYTAATDTALASKQTTLTAGTGISIVDNVISATGGGGGGMTEDDELLLSTALTDLNDRKIDASEVKANYQKKGDYATKDYVTTALEPYETKLDEINTEEVTAYALNDLNNRFGGLSIVKITESEYAALTAKDENTLYVVVADPS